MKQNSIEIVDKIDFASAYEELAHPASGGICIFTGSVRDNSKGKKVNSLFFEAYKKMALKEMEKIAAEAFKKWKLNFLVMKHVVGEKKVMEPVVLVGASSAHRDACFEACRFLIDTLKSKVPIWKKEMLENDEQWVSAHP